MRNKYGLSRDIPESIKRQVRQACGFGCIICGSSIIDYEHVDPEFARAHKHDPEKITLLCPQCHAKVTRRFMSKHAVRAAMKDPCCKRTGYSSEFLELGFAHPTVIFGTVAFKNCRTVLRVAGMDVLQINKPEEEGAPFRLSATFLDSHGARSLDIRDNEWRLYTGNWDATVSGGSIIIRDGNGETVLHLISQPPDGIVIERLLMNVFGRRITAGRDGVQCKYPDGKILGDIDGLAERLSDSLTHASNVYAFRFRGGGLSNLTLDASGHNGVNFW